MRTTPGDLAGRLAVVSGAGSGIGAALATYAATRLDMHAAVIDVDGDRAAEVVDRIEAGGGRATALTCDVSDWVSTHAAAEQLLAEHGAPALVAANAGIELTGPVWEADPQDWQRLQGVNLTGAFHLVRAFVPSMIAAGRRGHVLCTSSIAGLGASAGQAAYAVSKHGVRVLAQSLEHDLAQVGADVGVSVLVPGVVRTRIFEDALTTGAAAAEEQRRAYAAFLADGMSPDDLAATTFDAILAGKRWIHPEPHMSRMMLDPMAADLSSGIEDAEAS